MSVIEDKNRSEPQVEDDPLNIDVFWEGVFRRVWPSLTRFFRRKYPEYGDDLAQDTLIKAIHSFDINAIQPLSREDRVAVFGAYLWRAAQSVAADYYRRKTKQQAEEAATWNKNLHPLDPLITRNEFTKTMGSWSSEDLQIVSLRIADNMTWAKIAEVINQRRAEVGAKPIKLAAVKMRFQRALKLGVVLRRDVEHLSYEADRTHRPA